MTDINPMTGRTEAEEQFVRFIYYLGMAKNLLNKEALEVLKAHDYPVKEVLTEIESYFKNEREKISDFRY